MKKLFKIINNFFGGRSTRDNPLDEDYTDDFRIKVIKLKSGVTKHFPQYKSGIMDQWETLVSINNKGIGSLHISDVEMIHTNISYCTKEEADSYIEDYKQQLIKQRSNEYLDEEIIKL